MMTTDLDQRDSDILAERQAGLDAKRSPKVGDYVRFDNGKYLRITYAMDDRYQLDNRCKGRFYLGATGFCDYSGGLSSGVPASALTRTDERKPAPVWFFHHDQHKAHNGIDVVAEFPVWDAGAYSDSY